MDYKETYEYRSGFKSGYEEGYKEALKLYVDKLTIGERLDISENSLYVLSLK